MDLLDLLAVQVTLKSPLQTIIQKQRHYFANKDLSRQGYGFSVVMYGCESWAIKKAEHRRTDAFKLWVGEDF